MGKKVYDPIHDVFQDQLESDSESRLASSERGGISYERGREEADDDSNTESEDNGSGSLYAKESLVPSVTTSKKKMKESSKYNRHLKKPDGEFFSRRDLQFHFLRQLLIDSRPIFTNIFKEVYAKSVVPLPSIEGKIVNVTDENYDARTFIFNDKLTFSQLYILSLASSTKCSKVLRDKLLLDHQVAFSTCILALLVNIGRLNTTINFYLEMTSQLRTFHSVPCLQYKVADLKSLQDTPRLKSILKNLPVGNEPLDLNKRYESEESVSKHEKVNVVNLLFTMCDNVSLINLKLLSKYVDTNGKPVSLFNILDSPGYEPVDRCNVLLWLLYIHTETDLTADAIQQSIKLFTEKDKLPLQPTDHEYDEDPESEYEFGMEQKIKRKEFLKRIKHTNAEEEEEEPVNGHDRIEEDAEKDSSGEDEKDEGHRDDDDGEVNEELDETIQDTDSLDDEMLESATPRRKRDLSVKGKDNRQTKRRKVDDSHVKSQEKASESSVRASKNVKIENATRIDKLIEMDKNKVVGEVNHEPKSHETFIRDLLLSQAPVRLKRKDLGLVKIFHEYEDIPMASVIGIRGKKRKKFKDNVLGLETDYLRSFAAAKRIMLRYQDNSDDESNEVFQL